MLEQQCNTNVPFFSTKKLRRRLRRIPYYAEILSSKSGVSRMTVYRVLRGDSSPKSQEIITNAHELLKNPRLRATRLTKHNQNGESRN